MSIPYLSSDPAVTGFIASQNSAAGGRGSTITFAPAIENNGLAGSTTNNVIGFAAISAGAPAIAMGSGVNSVIVDGTHSTIPAVSAPDAMFFSVDPTGVVWLTDANTNQSVSISGVSYLIFNGAATTKDGSYQSIYFIGNANQTEITELYNAAFGRQPDLGGVEYYMNQLKAGVTFQSIAGEFIASPEFQSRYGANVTDAQFITNLYQNVLHRAPAPGDIAWYQTNVIAAILNGAVAGTAAYLAADLVARETLLQDFTNSPENQADVSGWVINTSGTVTNGFIYVDQQFGAEQPAQLLTAAANGSGSLINTNLLAPGSLSGIPNAGLTINNVVISPSNSSIGDFYNNNVTFILSDTVRNASISLQPNDTVFGDVSGDSIVQFDQNGGTVHFYGSYNFVDGGATILGLVSNPLVVTGFASGDSIWFDRAWTGAIVDIATKFLDGSATQISGAALSSTFGSITYVIQTPAIASLNPANLVLAANTAFSPSQTASGGTISGQQAIFEASYANPTTGTTDTVLFHWTDSGNHQITTTSIDAIVDLVGVPSSIVNPAITTIHHLPPS